MSELAGVDAPLMEERDHPLRPWVIAGLVLLAGLAVAGVLYYSPLRPGGVMHCPDDAVLVPPPETEEGGSAGADLCLVTYAADLDMTFGLSVRNDGPLAVTVTGLAFDTALRELLDVRAVRAGASPDDLRELEPFRLGSGEERYIEVAARLLPCEPRQEGRLVSVRALPVRTRFAGVGRTTSVLLANELSVLLTDCRR